MSDYLSSLFGLQGKVAVVIGGTGELCGAMAEGLARAGAEVILAGRSQEKADKRLARIAENGGSGYFVACDLSSKQGVQALLDEVLEKSGKVDILVNGAGANAATPFLEIPEEEWNRIFDINLNAVYRACQVFGKYFVEADHPTNIINVGSMSALFPLSRVFTYSATKAAVHNLSKNLAREWAPHGVRVNTLVPGFFPAEQNRKVLTQERVASIMNHTPMDRFGKAEELVGITLLLASDNAASFITGTEMVIDGGYAAMSI